MKIRLETQLILDFILCTLFTLISMFLMSLIFPDGIAYKFLLRSIKLIGPIFGSLVIIFIIFRYFDKSFQFKKKFSFPDLKDYILLFLPISPIIDYILINNNYLSINGLIYLLVITISFILFFSFLLPIIFSYFGSYKIIMITGIALSFTILSLAKIASNPNSHIFNSQFVTQGSYLIISFTFIYLFYLINKTAAYSLVFIFMISGSLINFYNNYSESTTTSINPEKIVKFLNNEENKINKKKNIYILIYESYPNLETLNYYGYDNLEQINFLEENGFTVYHGIYSAGASSIASTSRMLEIEGELSKHGRYYVSGNAFVPKVFKSNDYKTIALFKSSFYLDSTSSITWDEYYPKEDVTKIGWKTLTKSIFQGEFKFDIFDEFSSYEEYLKMKDKYLSLKKSNTLFYTHNGYPGHSGNSGVCDYSTEKNEYFKGMGIANKEMNNDVKSILINDPESIIVLVGDHGPYLTKNCRELRNYDASTIDKYDVQDRYGAFLSIYWPSDISNKNKDIQIIQDIFPAILSNITNNNKLFDELKIERKFFDRFNNITGGVNVINGILDSGKDKGNPLFDQRTYEISQ